ncbi:hypothetical protein CcI156_16260 [Frankia sp. CcI156]|uniref:Integral membrane protein n=1 Tax=Frankia casuarinae (strain DSM 45818 / CECT 9043 / HFP020203 / CcI3) TaxID=106370 RepID=Q2J6C6_FRACC|nr:MULTISPECIES: DUF1003 domain-containing protein [Frankia]ABD13166.1 protein of unknown function DUF1003 [Frankia casuarinae]ETA01261.1 putative membrane protein [Frankia sp. CcI6]EYT89963.1 putative membrane protein [Frankia casuarinae]KFB06328.1 putative membrane protein [Frankia sp. Allo2]OAA22825.1 putative membrane protein [Frankia casuarinae]
MRRLGGLGGLGRLGGLGGLGRRRPRGARLDQPRLSRRSALRSAYEPDAFGRIAERVARFIGTARYLVAQSVVIVLWVAYNIIAPQSVRFDNFPFIFLTLVLSLQAAYAAPLILLAQNRQDDRDRANLAQDREQTIRNREDTEYLARELAAMRITIGELATRDFLRSELRGLLAELEGPDGDRAKDRDRERRRRRGGERSLRPP